MEDDGCDTPQQEHNEEEDDQDEIMRKSNGQQIIAKIQQLRQLN